MSKTVKNIVILLALAGSVLVNPMCSSASETRVNIVDTIIEGQDQSKELLSLDESIDSALKNSETIALYDKKISYQNKINKTNANLEDATDTDDDLKDYNDDTRKINIQTLKQQKEFEEDKLKQKVTDAYNSLIYTEIQINTLNAQLDVQKKKLEDTRLMNKLKMNTSIDTTEYDLNIQTLTNNINTLNNTLSNAKESFKTLTGQDVGYYRLDTNIQYDKFVIDGDIDEYIDGVINKYLKYNEKSLKLTKDYLNDNEVDDPGKFDEDKPKLRDYKDDDNVNGKTAIQKYNEAYQKSLEDYVSSIGDKVDSISTKDVGRFDKVKPDISQFTSDSTGKTAQQKYQEALAEYTKELQEYTQDAADRIKYLQSKLSTYESDVSLNEQKKNLKEALKSYYSLLISKENEINLKKQQIELDDQKSEVAKQKYSLGLISRTDFDNIYLTRYNKSLELRKLVNDYNQTKVKIEKPWIGLN